MKCHAVGVPFPKVSSFHLFIFLLYLVGTPAITDDVCLLFIQPLDLCVSYMSVFLASLSLVRQSRLTNRSGGLSINNFGVGYCTIRAVRVA